MSARRPSPQDKLFVIGVTGGIASGKSTFVRILESRAPSVTIDADRLGHAVLEDAAVGRALAREFGPDVLDAQGRVDRARLGPRAFASPERLEALNRIVHPPLLELAMAAIAAEASRGFAGLCVLDAALLVEWDAGRWCDRVVAVLADPARQTEFLTARAGLAKDDAERRVALQLPNEARAAYADDVLVNDGTLAQLTTRANELADALAARSRAELAARAVVR